SVDLNGYIHHGRDAFESSEISNSRVFVPTNFAREHSAGLEFTLTMRRLESVGLSGRLSYALARTDVYGPISGGLADEALEAGERRFPAYDQRHTATASLQYRTEKLRRLWLGNSLSYGSGTPATLHEAGEEVHLRLPQHLTADLAGGFNVWQRSGHERLHFAAELIKPAHTPSQIPQ